MVAVANGATGFPVVVVFGLAFALEVVSAIAWVAGDLLVAVAVAVAVAAVVPRESPHREVLGR